MKPAHHCLWIEMRFLYLFCFRRQPFSNLRYNFLGFPDHLDTRLPNLEEPQSFTMLCPVTAGIAIIVEAADYFYDSYYS
jgi:hypothetical protein